MYRLYSVLDNVIVSSCNVIHCYSNGMMCVLSSGCCDSIFEALSTQAKCAEVAFQCVLALGSVVVDVSDTIKRIAKKSVLNLLKELFESHPRHDPLAWAICRLVSFLGEYHGLLMETNTYHLVVTILTSRLSLDQIDSSASLEEVNRGNHPGVGPLVAEESRGKLSTSPTETNDTKVVVEWAARCIGCLAVSAESRVALGEVKACETLVVALQRYMGSSEFITREGILALACLCDGPSAIGSGTVVTLTCILSMTSSEGK